MRGDYLLSELAKRLNKLSTEWFGKNNGIVLIGKSLEFIEAQKKIFKFAGLDKPILITGESGVGKELFAKSIYLLSKRRSKRFICVNCANYRDDNVLVSELFGHKRGSFTGAVSDNPGLFKSANNGILFMDEIGELSLNVQGMLLRVLADGDIKSLGAYVNEKVNVQIIAATNKDLQTMVKKGDFRSDLYYRIRHFRLDIPPLRRRSTDVELLVSYYLDRFNEVKGTQKNFSPDALQFLRAYHWPGNIRELKSIIEMAAILSEGQKLEPADFVHELDMERHHLQRRSLEKPDADLYIEKMTKEERSFWEVVHKPYLDRELNRSQVQDIVLSGLNQTNGSYKRLVKMFKMPDCDYLKFMDFLRHHRLKPSREIGHKSQFGTGG